MPYRLVLSWIAAVILSHAASNGQAPPAGFGKPDHVLRVGVRPGQLRFDKELLQVASASRVQLVFHNNDAMQHNLLICRPGEKIADRVGFLAAKLGAKAPEVDFAPDSPDVLFHTKAILPGQTDTLWFVAPKEAGDYPYVCTLPGHMFTMRGVLRVGAGGGGVAFGGWKYSVYKGKWTKLPAFEGLEAVRHDTAEVLEVRSMDEAHDFALLATGVLELPRESKVRFFLNSDDGARLRVGDEVVLDYDGVHPARKEHVAERALAAGAHRLRLEYFQGGGGRELRVAVQAGDQPRLELARGGGGGGSRRPEGIPIPVVEEAVVMRVHVEGAAARSVAVGLPGGVNYCFDAERCEVQFFWSGGYLDVGPDRLGRGGNPCKILGRRFGCGAVGFPLRDAGGAAAIAQFRGYRLGATPTFFVTWGGQEVRWSIAGAAASLGLRYEFELPGRAAPVEFHVEPDGLQLSASAGTWRGGTLTVPAEAARRFSVTLVPGKEER